MTRNIASFVIVMLLTTFAWAADDQPAAEADQPTADEVKTAAALADLIEQIGAAELIQDAVAAYNTANVIERGRVDVNLAYMKKMLTFGRIDYAVYGARWILATEADNMLALSVLGYYDASAGDVEKALPSIIRALDQLPDDESLLADAGQLLAWMDIQEDRKRLPADIERILLTSRDEWAQQASFRKAYDEAMVVLQQYDDEITEITDIVEDIRQDGLALDDEIVVMVERIVPIDLEIYSLELELYAVETEMVGTYWNTVRLQEEIKDTNERITELEKIDSRTDGQNVELARRKADVVFFQQAIKASYHQWDRYQLRERAEYLRDMIRANQRERDELVVAIRRLMRNRNDVKDDFRHAKADLVVLKSDRRKMIRGIGRLLEWRLPAIDGVVINIAQVSQEYVGRTPRSRRVLSDEANAAGKLQLAKKYLEIDRREMAVKYLQLLLATFPDSAAAAEAGTLLELLHGQAEATP